MPIIDRVLSAWNAFRSTPAQESPLEYGTPTYGGQSPSRPVRRFIYNNKTIVTAIYNRISIDVADIYFRHVQVDAEGRYSEDIHSELNVCLELEPNLDQGPRAFRQDICMTLFDKGCAVIVPVDTTVDPETEEIYDIFSLRVGEVVQWYPKHVRVSLYNENKGARQEVVLLKRFVAIVENPLYSVMNEPNSTLQRLIRKLSLLDAVDEQSSSGRLDIIIQLPYTVRSDAKKIAAAKRLEEIEVQLKGSQYGIAYADATEKITQLNRPSENNLMTQVEFLVEMLYGQLGITPEVMNGTADEKAMINYHNRTVKPIVEAIVEAKQRAFIGPQRLRKLERIHYFNNPFKLVPVSVLAEITDKFTRNEVLTSNEIRSFIGVRPSKEPKADLLVNSNMPTKDTQLPTTETQLQTKVLERTSQNGS
jgi:hypothetical protein